MKMIEVTCAKCGEKFQKQLKRYNATEKRGGLHTCSRKCAAKVSNDKRVAPPSSKAAKNTRTDKEKNPEKVLARNLVRQAIKCGKIVPPKKCEQCKVPTNKIEAHHEDHDRPYYLCFLCKDCHAFHDKHKLAGYGTDYSENIK